MDIAMQEVCTPRPIYYFIWSDWEFFKTESLFSSYLLDHNVKRDMHKSCVANERVLNRTRHLCNWLHRWSNSSGWCEMYYIPL